MVQRQKCAVFIVVDKRCVQRAATKHPSADEVPECRTDNVCVGESVVERFMSPDLSVLPNSFHNQQNKRQHLDEREHAAHWHPHAGPSGPIQVVTGSDDTAEKNQDQLEIDGPFRKLARHKANGHEEVGTHAGGEEFERLFDPQVNDPPSAKSR
jgi:hypothetical protein